LVVVLSQINLGVDGQQFQREQTLPRWRMWALMPGKPHCCLATMDLGTLITHLPCKKKGQMVNSSTKEYTENEMQEISWSNTSA
jgi:hypothetical protein